MTVIEGQVAFYAEIGAETVACAQDMSASCSFYKDESTFFVGEFAFFDSFAESLVPITVTAGLETLEGASMRVRETTTPSPTPKPTSAAPTVLETSLATTTDDTNLARPRATRHAVVARLALLAGGAVLL